MVLTWIAVHLVTNVLSPLRTYAIGPLTALVVSLLAIGVTVGIAAAARRRSVTVLATVVTPVVLLLMLNWSQFAPRLWFATHRPLYDLAAQIMPISDEYYGVALPLPLQHLTATGSVSSPDHEAQFYPLWLGIPDDAGGYFYSPNRSPEGLDMYGMICREPVDLGGGWWLCGFRDDVP